MLRRIDLTADPAGADLRRVLPRAVVDVHAALDAVTPVVAAGAERGYPGEREATLRFDGVDVADLVVHDSEPLDCLGSRPRQHRQAGRHHVPLLYAEGDLGRGDVELDEPGTGPL